MNYKLVFRLLGNILRIETVCLLLPLTVSLAGDGLDKVAFIITAALTGIVGQMLSMLPNDGRKMQARDGYATVALCWIVMSAFGALPYVFSGAIPNYIDAFFEDEARLICGECKLVKVLENARNKFFKLSEIEISLLREQ